MSTSFYQCNNSMQNFITFSCILILDIHVRYMLIPQKKIFIQQHILYSLLTNTSVVQHSTKCPCMLVSESPVFHQIKTKIYTVLHVFIDHGRGSLQITQNLILSQIHKLCFRTVMSGLKSEYVRIWNWGIPNRNRIHYKISKQIFWLVINRYILF